jgi:hypothetical protein
MEPGQLYNPAAGIGKTNEESLCAVFAERRIINMRWRCFNPEKHFNGIERHRPEENP